MHARTYPPRALVLRQGGAEDARAAPKQGLHRHGGRLRPTPILSHCLLTADVVIIGLIPLRGRGRRRRLSARVAHADADAAALEHASMELYVRVWVWVLMAMHSGFGYKWMGKG